MLRWSRRLGHVGQWSHGSSVLVGRIRSLGHVGRSHSSLQSPWTVAYAGLIGQLVVSFLLVTSVSCIGHIGLTRRLSWFGGSRRSL